MTTPATHRELSSNGYKWIYDDEGAHFYSKEFEKVNGD